MTTTLQAFKENDALEKKVSDCFLPLLTALGVERDNFFEGATEAYPLGSVLWALQRSPLARLLDELAFKKSFTAIHEFFTRPGTFEFYLDIFRTLFGADVEVTFTIPGDGQLSIDIEALTTELENFIVRRIVGDAYVYENLVDQDGDNILFQGLVGITTQDELDALMRELRVAGVFTEAELILS